MKDSILVDLVVNSKSLVVISDNELEIYNDSTEMLELYISNAELGVHKLKIDIKNKEDSITIFRNFIVLQSDEVLVDPPLESPYGLTHNADSTYLFKIRAPGKKHIFLLAPQNNFNVDLDYRLRKSADGETFWLSVDRENFEENATTYQFLVDGNLRIADPYSVLVLDPWNDDGIDQSVLEELPAYPADQTTGIVSVFDYEKVEYPWTDGVEYKKPDQSNLVIYELLMRDFLSDKSYVSLLDTLDYLDKLGVTAIELMPINEFEGNQSWGYNCSFHMALDKYYGSRSQLKAVVNAAHERGIAVIMDVVYNHVFSQSPLAQLYWDAGSFRPTADNPWLNVTAKHPFNVGYDVNHESSATKEWVKQTLGYWMTEFHIDGFRLDLSKGFTQKNSGQNADLMAQYDSGRIATLKDYADHVWSVNPEAYVILEHFAYNEEEIELANYGMMLWGNMHHEFSEAVKGKSSDLEWLDYSERGWDSPHVVGYMESHDEERQMVNLVNSGFSLERALERIETASAIFYMVPGPKMLWQFGEVGFDYSINRCVNGSVNNDCRLDPKPVVWDYLENEQRSELNGIVSNLLYLKSEYPTFSSSDFNFNDGNLFLKTIHFDHEDMDAVVMANFRETTSEINPKFQNPGVWYEYFTGDSLVVEDTQEKLSHIGGEYRIYTSERITPPSGFTTGVSGLIDVNVSIFPNPVRVGERLNVELEGRIEKMELFDRFGRSVSESYQVETLQLSGSLVSGKYYLRVTTSKGISIQSLIVI